MIPDIPTGNEDPVVERARSVAPAEHGGGGRLRLAVEVLALYLRVRLISHRHDVRRVLGELRDRRLSHAPIAAKRDEDPVRLARATARVLGLLPGDTRCLTQSLVLSALLARRGRRGRVVIAVRSPDQEFGAHAWVELDGRALLPAGVPGDARLVEL